MQGRGEGKKMQDMTRPTDRPTDLTRPDPTGPDHPPAPQSTTCAIYLFPLLNARFWSPKIDPGIILHLR